MAIFKVTIPKYEYGLVGEKAFKRVSYDSICREVDCDNITDACLKVMSEAGGLEYLKKNGFNTSWVKVEEVVSGERFQVSITGVIKKDET